MRFGAAVIGGRGRPVFLGQSLVDIAGIDGAFAVGLHMHQPLIPAGGPDLRTAAIVSNLQWMLEHPDLGDNHNAPVFHWCYRRMGELIPQLLGEGRQPRVMMARVRAAPDGLPRALSGVRRRSRRAGRHRAGRSGLAAVAGSLTARSQSRPCGSRPSLAVGGGHRDASGMAGRRLVSWLAGGGPA